MSTRISVRKASKEYRECSLEIVEEKLIIRIICVERGRLRKPRIVSFEESLWRLSSRKGSEITVGDATISFPSDGEACSFIKRALSISYGRAFERVSSTLINYLRRRSEILMLLRSLSTSPRVTLISMANQLIGCEADPFDCAVEKLKKENSELYKKLLEEIGTSLSTAPKDLMESVLNIARRIGALQAGILRGGGDDVKRTIESIERDLGYSIDRARIERLQISPSTADLNSLVEEILNIWASRMIAGVNNKFLC